MHSELSEALGAYRERELEAYTPPDDVIGQPGKLGTTRQPHPFPGVGGYVNVKVSTKPEGVVYELADVVIRVADMAEFYGVDLERVVIEARTDPNRAQYLYVRTYEIGASPSFGDWISQLHSRLTDIWNGGLRYAWGQIWQNPIGLFVHDIERMAAHYGIDLDAAIEGETRI